MSWLLGFKYNQGHIPSLSKIYLLPHKDSGEDLSARVARKVQLMTVENKAYMPFVLNAHNLFLSYSSQVMNEHLKSRGLSPKGNKKPVARRDPVLSGSSWSSYVKDLLDKEHALSMMPLPPSVLEEERLKEFGFSTLRSLSKLNVNSKAFKRLCLKTGIYPERMKWFIAHAKATASSKVIVMDSFEDPLKSKSAIFHTDFENLMNLQTYQFGVSVQRGSRVASVDRKVFDVWNSNKANSPLNASDNSLKTSSVNQTWAEYLRYFEENLKQHPDMAVTIYSKHEFSMFKHQFKIQKLNPNKVPESKKSSEYYFERFNEDGELEGYKIGYYDFFRRYNIKPSLIAEFFNRSVDLFHYTRRFLAFPVHSNSLKHVLEFTKAPFSYMGWQNGLESISWALKILETQDPDEMKKSRAYVSQDAEANFWVAKMIAEYSKLPVESSVNFSAKELYSLDSFNLRVSVERKIAHLLSLNKMIKAIAGDRFENLSQDLKSFIWSNFSGYYKMLSHTVIVKENSALSDSEKAMKIEEYNFKLQQKTFLERVHLAESVHPDLYTQMESDVFQSLHDLNSLPVNRVLTSHLNQMLYLNQVLKYSAAEIDFDDCSLLEFKDWFRKKVVETPFEFFNSDGESVFAKNLTEIRDLVKYQDVESLAYFYMKSL